MSPAEKTRIRVAARIRTEREMREQGIPQQITDPILTVELARLLRRSA
jgi:hypothetical protein